MRKLMKIKDIQTITQIRPTTSAYEPYYNSSGWYTYIYNKLPAVIKGLYPTRIIQHAYTEEEAIQLAKDAWILNMELNDYKYNKLFATLDLEYNPIWNVDGTETEERNYSENSKGNTTGSDATTYNSGVSNTRTDSKTSYDSASFNDTDKSAVSESHTGTDSRATDEDRTDSKEGSELVTRTRQGNIGVTSTQSLIDQERDIADFSFLKHVAHDYINLFTYNFYDYDGGIDLWQI